MHGLSPHSLLFAAQNPEVVDAGVIHNDVISTGNKSFFIYHEKAFVDTPKVIGQLKEKMPLNTFCVTEKMLSVTEAVTTYFFNGQIVTLPNGEDLMVLPEECQILNLEWLPLRKVFINLQESMSNGGGPACLRLRFEMNEEQKNALPSSIFLTESLYTALKEWIEKHYREELSWGDLQDPLLFEEVEEAYATLTEILDLGLFYEFQRTLT